MYIDVARSRVARQLLFLPYKQGLPESANSAAGPGYILMQLPPHESGWNRRTAGRHVPVPRRLLRHQQARYQHGWHEQPCVRPAH